MSRTALRERAVDRRVVDLEVHDLSGDELVEGLRDAAVADALDRKPANDPVAATVWWLVVDALRRSLVLAGSGVARDRSIAAAVVAVERASWELTDDVPMLLTSTRPPAVRPAVPDAARALRRAQVLVTRLVLSPGPTSPTLLQVRLDRLSRALVAGLSPG